jgi:xanthine dehydrogenase YagR molybdenum-binding subunit
MDPIALRLRNYSDRDQNSEAPYTSKALRECYRRGAEAFDWDRRSPQPRSMRDGSELVGLGMATGIWEALENLFTTRVVLTDNNHAEVSCAASDLGTGTYTIMTQVTADALGLPLENVSVRLGDSTLPHAPVAGGSWTAASIANAIVATCDELTAELLRLAQTAADSPLAGVSPQDAVLVNSAVTSKHDPGRAALTGSNERNQTRPRAMRATRATPIRPSLPRSRSTSRSVSFASLASSARSLPDASSTSKRRAAKFLAASSWALAWRCMRRLAPTTGLAAS